jgi:putative transcriptional regulator
MDLTNQFLIAMPGMEDPNFSRTVVYICEHSPAGAMGVVINRPTELTLASLFHKIDLRLEISPWSDAPVLLGGPLQIERGFVLHSPAAGYSSTLSVTDSLALTTSRDILEAVANGGGPERLMVALGYAGWGAGQLERELGQNGWLTVPASPDLIFDTPVTDRFEAALALLGVNVLSLMHGAGHA